MLKTHRVIQGDRRFIRFALFNNGQPWPVAGWTWRLTVKASVEEADADALFVKTSAASQIQPYDTTSVYVVIDPADTAGKTPERYHYDLQGTSPEGDPVTTERGYIVLDPEVGRS